MFIIVLLPLADEEFPFVELAPLFCIEAEPVSRPDVVAELVTGVNVEFALPLEVSRLIEVGFRSSLLICMGLFVILGFALTKSRPVLG